MSCAVRPPTRCDTLIVGRSTPARAYAEEWQRTALHKHLCAALARAAASRNLTLTDTWVTATPATNPALGGVIRRSPEIVVVTASGTAVPHTAPALHPDV